MQSKIKKFNDTLSKYMWACVVDGKLAPNDEDYWTEYRTVPPNVFERLKAGCCWDYCNYQADYFKKNFPGIKFSLYYIDSDDINEKDSTNHTWMAYFLDGRVYAFEASWKAYKGVHEFKSVDEMLDWYAKNQFRNYKKAGYPPYVIYEYERPPKDNLKAEDFMLYIFRYGKLLRNHNGKFEKYVKPLNLAGWKWIWTDTFYFYHLVPKGSDVSVGLLSPYGLAKTDKKLALKALNKYRNRMVSEWKIYPGRDPSSLTLVELISGLEKFRDKGGSRQIYFFRYPPDASLGPNMKKELKNIDIYRINLMDKELQKHIERIYWGSFGSFSGNKELTEEYYRVVTRKEYFKDYKDNPKPGVPPFAPIPHIGIVFKNGICPAKFIKKFEIVSEQMINSHDEMCAMMEVTYNDKRKPFLEKIVTETGHWPEWMNAEQIQYVQENGFNMESNQSAGSLKEYAEQLKANGLISGYDINNNELKLSSVSGKYKELEDRVKTSIGSLGAYSYSKIINKGRMPVPGYPKLWLRPKSETADESSSTKLPNNDLFPVTEAMLATMSFIPHKTEIKNCFHTMKGPTKKAMPNLIIHKDGKNYRARSELLLFKGNQILLTKEDKVNHYGTRYKLPGGGIDNPLESIERAAARECEEEVLIVPKDVTYTGIEFSKLFTKIPEWHKVCLHPDGIYYDGFMSFICTAKYDRDYKGYVKIVDRDAQASKAKFYPYPKVRYMLLPIHRKIADDFMKKKLDEDMRLFHMKPLNDLR